MLQIWQNRKTAEMLRDIVRVTCVCIDRSESRWMSRSVTGLMGKKNLVLPMSRHTRILRKATYSEGRPPPWCSACLVELKVEHILLHLHYVSFANARDDFVSCWSILFIRIVFESRFTFNNWSYQRYWFLSACFTGDTEQSSGRRRFRQ